MTKLHTQGKMQAGVSKFHGREVFTAVPTDNTQKIVALFGFCGADDEPESIANLRRFVALWNACEGIESHALELMTGNLAIKEQITASSKAKQRPATYRSIVYRQQRAELLEALKGLLANFEIGKSIATGQAVIKTDSLEVRTAYAAIAKVEGCAA